MFFFFLSFFICQSPFERSERRARVNYKSELGGLRKHCSYDMEIMTQSDYRRIDISPNMGLQRANLIPNTDSCTYAYVSISIFRVIRTLDVSNFIVSFSKFFFSRILLLT